MTISACLQVFFNTQAHQHRCVLQLMGEQCLTPVRFFFNGSTIHERFKPDLYVENKACVVLKWYAHEKARLQLAGDPKQWKEGSWQQWVIPRVVQVAMAILFIPGLVLGTALKLAAYILNTPAALLPCTPLKPVVVQQYNYVKDLQKGQSPNFLYSDIEKKITHREFADLSQSTRVIYEGKVYHLYRIKYIDANDPHARKINNYKDLENALSSSFISTYKIDSSVPPLEPIPYVRAPQSA